MNLFGVAWENILVGILSGAIVTSMALVKRKVQDKYLEKKYPIAGQYISKYEDELNGQIVWCSAPVNLRQKGNKVYGETKLPMDDRQWMLEGQVSVGGHIYGIYYASDPHDKGIGNFFLFINNNKYMEGLWSGYDSVNKKINSGKYIFMPTLKDFSIVDLIDDYIPTVIAISDDQLGKDYLTIDVLQQSISDSGKYFTRVALNSRKEVIGFCLCGVISPDELKNLLRIPPEEIPQALKYSKRIGLIGVLAVKDEYQKRGVGTALVNDCITKLNSANVAAMCCVGWRSSKGINIGGILSTCNFETLKEIPDYWREDSLQKNYRCHDCGEPPCTCSALIYARFR